MIPIEPVRAQGSEICVRGPEFKVPAALFRPFLETVLLKGLRIKSSKLFVDNVTFFFLITLKPRVE